MQSVDKKYFVLNKGINTEAPLVAWPEGFTIDEQNFDLLPDGSRRRRKGLGQEFGATTTTFGASGLNSDLSSETNFFRWQNVNNVEGERFIVGQLGSSVAFWDEPTSGPMNDPVYSFDLLQYKVRYTDSVTNETYAAADSDVRRSPVDFAEVDGKLFVTGLHTEPLVVERVDDGWTVSIVQIFERDMFGIDDGIANDVMPTTLSDTHRYNLYSRGWTDANIGEFFTEQGRYPSKNMIHFVGMRRQTEQGFAEDDGIKVFSPDKLVNEMFQNTSAPQGRIIRNVFNWRLGNQGIGEIPDWQDIAAIPAISSTNGTVTITTAAAAHGLNTGDYVDILGLDLELNTLSDTINFPMTGRYEVHSIIDTKNFRVKANLPAFTTLLKALSLGQFIENGLVEVEEVGFEPSKYRFSSVASFAGRAFYGGSADNRISNRVYYSRVIESEKDYGYCYQEADPTSEFISDLVASDGGYITIPGMGSLKKLIPFGSYLLVFATEGVWAIGPGEGGFSALSYTNNKVADAGCLSKHSVMVAENIPFYWSNAGIYMLSQDANSGFLSPQNVTQDTINGLFGAIRLQEKKRARGSYDPVRKRLVWLYNNRFEAQATGNAPLVGNDFTSSTAVTPIGIVDDTDTTQVIFNAALIFDLRLGAWTRWTFTSQTTPVKAVVGLPVTYSTEVDNGSLRFLCQVSGTQTALIAELTDPLFEDFGDETFAYILSGPDSIMEPERLKYAPYVHMFMRKEAMDDVVMDQSPEEGVSVNLGTAVNLEIADRDSSIYMQPRWDWSRGTDSGKMADFVQVYREVRPNSDALGLIVTKNKVRGRGRNLFLAFKAGPNSPAWIDGWTIKYDAQMRI